MTNVVLDRLRPVRLARQSGKLTEELGERFFQHRRYGRDRRCGCCKGAGNGQVGERVDKTTVFHVDKESIVVQEISSDEGASDICNQENPAKRSSEAKIEHDGA